MPWSGWGSHGKGVGPQGAGVEPKWGRGWNLVEVQWGVRGYDHILPPQLWEDEPTLQRVMAAMGIDR